MSYNYYVTTPGPRPVFWSIAWFLGGPDPSFDSDGDSIPADSATWTELTLILRDKNGYHVDGQQVDVDPYQEHPLVLKVRSENPLLALRVAYILARSTGGKLSADPHDSFRESDEYASELGQGFDLSQALEHFYQALKRP